MEGPVKKPFVAPKLTGVATLAEATLREAISSKTGL
jgi:hypothetical protein